MKRDSDKKNIKQLLAGNATRKSEARKCWTENQRTTR